MVEYAEKVQHLEGVTCTMSDHPGYMTLAEIQADLKATTEEIRALISLLGIQPTFFPEDKRRRYYKVEDVERMKKAVGR